MWVCPERQGFFYIVREEEKGIRMNSGKQKLVVVLATGSMLASCADPYRPYQSLNYDECYSAPAGYVIDREKYSPVPECWVFNTRRPTPKSGLTGGGAPSPSQPATPGDPVPQKPAVETPQFSSAGDGEVVSAEGKEFSAAGGGQSIASDERNTSDSTRDLAQDVRDTIDSIRSGAGN